MSKISFILAPALFALCFLLGKRILKFAGIASGHLQVPVETALGLGTLSYSVLILGSLGGFNMSGFLALLVILFGMIIPGIREGLAILRRELLVFINSGSGLFKIFLVMFTLIFMFNSLIPDQFYDVLVYHLAVPNAYLVHGKIIPVPFNVHSALPETAEMLFTLGMGWVRGDNLPLLFQLGFSLLILFTLTRLNPKSGWIAAMIWATAPIAVENIRFSKNDILFSLWILLSFSVLWTQKDRASIKSAALAGTFAGFAMGTKYTGIPFAAVFTLFIFYAVSEKTFPEKIKLAAIFNTAALLIFAPWLFKNILFFKNPLYPFFQNIFGWVNMSPANWQVFQLEQSQYLSGRWKFADIFITLWKNTFEGNKFPSMNFVGPVWIAFLPLVALQCVTSRKIRLLSSILAVVIVLSSTRTTLARYFILPLLPLFALTISECLDELTLSPSAGMFKGFIYAGMFINLIGWIPLLERLSYCRTALWGIPEPKQEKLFSEGYWDSVKFVNENLAETSKILFLGETKSHLFMRPVIAPSVHNEHWLAQILDQAGDSETIYEQMKARGITHILYNADEMERLKGYPMFSGLKGSRHELTKFWSNSLKIVYDSWPVKIYEINSDAPSHEPLPRTLEEFL